MGAFGGLLITNKGRALQAKAQTGVELHYTRIAIGDGSLSGQSPIEMNALISEKKSMAVTKLQTLTDGKAVVGTVLDNIGLVTGFYFRELGIFATDPDVGEILYCYGNAGATADYIPAGGGPDVYEKHIDAVVVIGSATNITATIDQSLVYVSVQDFTSHQTAAVLDHPDGSVTSAKIAAKAVGAAQIADNAVGSSQLAAGAATDTVTGNRTADPATATAYGLTGTITQLFSWVLKYLKALTGNTGPFDAPATTLSAAKAHIDATTGVHGSTSAATPNSIVQRDAAGRFKAANPAAADDVATKSTVDTAIAALINGSPGALDTLKELADAMGDDPNFAATVTNSLAQKLNASAYTAADVLAKIKTVDGAGSGLDADTLDSITSDGFARTVYHDAAALNDAYNLQSGIYTTDQGTSMGLPTAWYHIIHMHHFDNNGFNAQIALSLNAGAGYMHVRTASNGTWSGWAQIYNGANAPVTRDNGGVLEFFTGGVWKPVGAMFATKAKGSFNTTSTTTVTALSLTGPGRLATLAVRQNATGTTMQVSVIADGITIFTSDPFRTDNAWYLFSPHLTQVTLVSYPVEIDVVFKSSLVVQITGAAGATTFVEYVYQQ